MLVIFHLYAHEARIDLATTFIGRNGPCPRPAWPDLPGPIATFIGDPHLEGASISRSLLRGRFFPVQLLPDIHRNYSKAAASTLMVFSIWVIGMTHLAGHIRQQHRKGLQTSLTNSSFLAIVPWFVQDSRPTDRR